MNIIRKSIPNFITICNLLCGFLSIVATSEGQYELAVIWIFAGAVCDFLDGTAARLLNAKSPIGADLDSLSDVVSFGVAPGFLIFSVIGVHASEQMQWLRYFALAIPALSTLRLARFNNDARQSDRFFGLPVPANALFFCAIPFVISGDYPQWLIDIVSQPFTLVGASVIMSLLLVTNIPLFAFKFSSLSWKKNSFRYIYILMAIILLVFFQVAALLLLIPLYVIFSLVINRFSNDG